SFFFSSRRRHTRFSRDWSSDVCSSDLGRAGVPVLVSQPQDPLQARAGPAAAVERGRRRRRRASGVGGGVAAAAAGARRQAQGRLDRKSGGEGKRAGRGGRGGQGAQEQV